MVVNEFSTTDGDIFITENDETDDGIKKIKKRM